MAAVWVLDGAGTDASCALQTEIDAGRRIVVRVNEYTGGDNGQRPLLKIDPTLEQIDRNGARRREHVGARRDALESRPA